MKKLFLMLTFVLSALMLPAQNTLGSADDEARIAISPYVSKKLNFNAEVVKQLTNKMTGILTKNGAAGAANQRFIMTCNVEVNTEDIAPGVEAMYLYEITVNFIIGDGVEGTKFGMASQTCKGLGETKADAYLKAIRNIKISDPKFQSFVAEAKQKIVEYYNSKCDFIVAQAQMKADKADYDGAMAQLGSVPEVCKDCYTKCMAAVQPIYQKKIDKDGALKLGKAKGLWSAGLDYEAAEKAAAVLGEIDPNSSSYKAAAALNDEMAARLKEKEDREWNFVLKVQQDEVDMQKAELRAARDVAIAEAENQPTINYNTTIIDTWW